MGPMGMKHHTQPPRFTVHSSEMVMQNRMSVYCYRSCQRAGNCLIHALYTHIYIFIYLCIYTYIGNRTTLYLYLNPAALTCFREWATGSLNVSKRRESQKAQMPKHTSSLFAVRFEPSVGLSRIPYIILYPYILYIRKPCIPKPYRPLYPSTLRSDT